MSDKTGEVARLVALLLAAEAEEDELMQQAKEAAARCRHLREEAIPAAMAELGYEKVTLSDGTTITVKDEVYASIPSYYKEEAMRWLQDNGFGGLIKNDMRLQFARGEDHDLDEVAAFLQASGVPFKLSPTVHPQTLKAFLKEQLTAGTALPLELFGARPVTVAKVKR